MKKFLNNMVDFFTSKEDDGYEGEPVRETRESRSETRAESKWGSREPKESRDTRSSYDSREQRTAAEPRESRDAASASAGSFEDSAEKRSKVVNIQATAQLQVVLVKPEVFTDAKQIADHLISKRTVVLNLETASSENKRRIIDFLVGVAYANGGSLKPVANLTYIITPYNVGFIGEDLVNELGSNGVAMM